MTHFRGFSRLIGPLGAVLLSGCGARTSATDPLRGFAASVVAARAFDRARTALARDDSAALQRAGEELRRAANAGSGIDFTPAFATVISDEATQLNAQATLAKGAEKARLLAESDEKYRAALAFTPQTAPEKFLNAQTLNALGYFLADRGQNRADFDRAAQMTRAAYASSAILSGLLSGPSQVSRALGPQDSYAWALFKLGKFKEAQKQEEEALEIARQIMPSAVSPDIPFHLAEIYRALGESEKARRQYAEALKLAPDDELKAKIDDGLKKLGG